MIVNVIGSPGAGKTEYIQKKFNFSPPQKHIDDEVFFYFKNKKVFEHTGLNKKINEYLNSSDEVILTIWIKEKRIKCIFRILKDFIKRKTTFKKFIERIKISNYYFKNQKKITRILNREKNIILLG